MSKTYSCRTCGKRFPKLGHLSNHHRKFHSRGFGKSDANLYKLSRRTISTLPTTPRRSTHHTKSQHAVNYCPSCGFHIGGLPT